MDENEFEIDGKVYVSVVKTSFPFCRGCAFEDLPCEDTPPCTVNQGKDETNVIFVEKQP